MGVRPSQDRTHVDQTQVITATIIATARENRNKPDPDHSVIQFGRDTPPTLSFPVPCAKNLGDSWRVFRLLVFR